MPGCLRAINDGKRDVKQQVADLRRFGFFRSPEQLCHGFFQLGANAFQDWKQMQKAG